LALAPAAALALALAARPCAAAGAGDDATELMRRGEGNNRLARDRREVFDYRLVITKQHLDTDSAVKRTSREEQRISARERETFSVEAAGGNGGAARKTEFKEVCDFATMLPRYVWTLAGEAVLDGEPCLLVRYEPKPDLPYASREEKVMNNTGGTLWISRRQEQVVRNKAALVRPVSVAWFFATVESIEFDYIAQRLPNGDWGPASLEYEFRVRIPFGSLRQRERREMSDYRAGRNPAQPERNHGP
jgi:hypothetical protein